MRTFSSFLEHFKSPTESDFEAVSVGNFIIQRLKISVLRAVLLGCFSGYFPEGF